MKNTLRFVSALFAFIMVFGLVACGTAGNGDDTANQTTAAEAESVETVDNTKDENGYELDDLPSNLNFGSTVNVLYWDDCERVEFEVLQDELDGSIVEEAIFNRNLKTEEKLGIKFEWIGQPGNNSKRASFCDYVTRSYNGGTYYDIIASYTRTVGMLIQRGMMYDLNSIDDSYLNLEKPWWPAEATETLSIGDSLYCISGDISTNVLHFMYAIYYNMDMITDLNMDDPVTFVDNKTWTIDKLIEMSSNLYADNNQNGKADNDDNYGFGTIYYHVDAFYTGSNLKLVDSDPDKLLVISPDFNSDKAVNLVDKLGRWLTTPTCYVSKDGAAVDYYYPFVDGHMLFCQNRVYMADNQYGGAAHNLNSVSWNYGILPTPLYDADQENYCTVVGNPFTLWGIMAGVSDKQASCASAVMESLASQAYRLVTPALFETNMKYRYTNSSDDKGARMFDILHNTLRFDLGRIFSDDLNYMSELPSKLATTGGSWGAAKKGHYTILGKKCESLVDALRAMMD